MQNHDIETTGPDKSKLVVQRRPTNPTSLMPQGGTRVPQTESYLVQSGSNPLLLQNLLSGPPAHQLVYDPSAVGNARDEIARLLTPAGTPDTERPVLGGRGASAQVGALGQAQQNIQTNVDQAHQVLEDALRSQRQRAIGDTSSRDEGAGNIRKRTDNLTDAEYNALSPKQKAAVDFNTMLVQAVRRDRNLSGTYDPNKQQRQFYDAAVEKMFGGEDRGSLQYAPETLGVLKQIGYQDDQADLNDFLSLKATIKASDLKDLAPGAVLPEENARVADSQPTVAADRLNLTQTLANSTQRMEAAIAKGTNLLMSYPNITQAAYVERGNLLEPIGAIQREQPGAPAMVGYGPPTDDNGSMTIDGYFQDMFGQLIAKANQADKNKLLGIMAQDLTPAEIESFKAYAQSRTASSERFNVPLGDDTVKPERIKSTLGLDQGGGY